MTHLRIIALILFTSITFSFASLQTKQQIFLQLTDASGKAIPGTSVIRGYERQIIVTSFSGVTSGNPEVQLAIPSGAASATLMNLHNSKLKLHSALISVTIPGDDKLQLHSTVRLESILVVNLREADGTSHITLKADRMGSTYFQHDRKTGIRTASGRTGYDFQSKQPWTNF